MKKPILYVFLISHYCEKARWALDYCGIDYELKLLSPLNHAKATQAAGAANSALPVLQVQGNQVIQGSAPIIQWAQKNANTEHGKGLLINHASIELEQQADDVLGIHIRRWFYSEALLDCPEIVKPVFAQGASLKDKIILHIAWPKVVKVMIKRMDLGEKQEQESKSIVLNELDKLDALLKNSTGDGVNKYLVDDCFSNADIAFASLLAPCFGPPKHPANSVFKLPNRIQQALPELMQRPSVQWLMSLYQNKR